MPDYEHDVFISYKRDPWKVFDEWLNGHFLPLFMIQVGNAIAAHCGRAMTSVFFDQAVLSDSIRKLEGIEPGEEWRNALQDAIRRSRCVVALWSPEYFLSEWCQKEWRSFYARQAELVIPVAVHDGHKFPADAVRLQFKNLSPYVIVGDGFKKTEQFVSFQNEIQELAEKVGMVVAAAPAFQEWPIVPLALTQMPAKEEPIPQGRL